MNRNTLDMGRERGMHPPNPVFRHFGAASGILHTPPCVWERPPVVNNLGNRVAASMFRPRMLRSGHKIHNESAARWLCFVSDAPDHAKTCAYFCLPNTVVSCETVQIAVFRRPTHANKANGNERRSRRKQGILKHCHPD